MRIMKFRLHRTTVAAGGALVLTAFATLPVSAGDGDMSGNDWKGAAHDAWLDGKSEAAFTANRYLNPFRIGTQVHEGVATVNNELKVQF